MRSFRLRHVLFVTSEAKIGAVHGLPLKFNSISLVGPYQRAHHPSGHCRNKDLKLLEPSSLSDLFGS